MLNIKQGRLIVISGPSGSGKTTIVNDLCKLEQRLQRSISATTRKPRYYEKDGVHYYFLSETEFMKKIENGEFAEWTEYNSNLYGTLKATITESLKNDQELIMAIDVRGAERLQKLYPDGLFIFIISPSQSTLKSRLKRRGTESDDEISRRLSIAQKEFDHVKNYNYIVVNHENKIDQTVEQLRCILEAERCRVNKCILEAIEKEFLK